MILGQEAKQMVVRWVKPENPVVEKLHLDEVSPGPVCTRG